MEMSPDLTKQRRKRASSIKQGVNLYLPIFVHFDLMRTISLLPLASHLLKPRARTVTTIPYREKLDE